MLGDLDLKILISFSASLFVLLCEELASRGALDTAMRGKDEDEAAQLLKFFTAYFEQPVASLNNSILRSVVIFLSKNHRLLRLRSIFRHLKL